MSKNKREFRNLGIDPMQVINSYMMSDSELMEKIKAMGDKLLNKLNGQIESFKFIKDLLSSDPEFATPYAINVCELLVNIKNKTWSTQSDIKENF